MRTPRVVSAFLLAFAVVSCGGGGADSGTTTATVSGTVLDSRGDPVSGATVTITSDPVAATTDSAGHFAAQVEVGDHNLAAAKGADPISTMAFSVPDENPVDLGDILPTSPYFPWYADTDSDGYGNSQVIVSSESKPAGMYTTDFTDCDDSNGSVNPGAVEACNDVDDNCDLAVDEGFDSDGDGYKTCENDCDDSSAAVNPGASETCNGVDDNCTGGIDEGVLITFYQDGDSDTFGSSLITTQACTAPSGFVADSTDCDDSDGAVNPDATEVCNGIDDNCADGIDDGVLLTFYQDSDTDGYGDPSVHLDACTATGVFVDNSLDCDDTDEFINPDATEVCDGVDNNCAGGVDEGLLTTYYLDFDEDTYGDPLNSTAECSQPVGYVANSSDCDDSDGTVNPDGVEVCDDKDNDCSGTADEGLLTTYYQDGDSDTYGSAVATTESCTMPTGYVDNNTDCDDGDGTINPAATEVCDGVDNNCTAGVDEGLLTTYYADSDTDTYGDPLSTPQDACTAPSGYVADSTDCDDSDILVNPAATEICDGVDNNCVDGVDEGLLTTYYADSDTDTYGDPLSTPQDACTPPSGYVVDNTDCDDTTAAVNPAAIEVCDGIDNNCVDGIDEALTQTWYRDLDADGYGDPAWPQDDCSQPHLYVADNTDCDDGDPEMNPETVWYTDNDSDQWPTSTTPINQCASPGVGFVPDHTFTLFDCDDTAGTLSPGNLEIQGNSIDDDCNPATSDNLMAYNLSDLAGTWTIVGVNTGDWASSQWNGWIDGTIAFDSKGQFTHYNLTYDNGDEEDTPSFTQLWVHSDGTITTTEAPELHGALSQDKDTIAATFSDEEGGYTMYLLQKQAVAVTYDDFLGLWYGAGIAAADSPEFSGWIRGSFNVQPGGMALIQHTDSGGNYEDGYQYTGLEGSQTLSDLEIVRYLAPDGQMVLGRGDYRNGSLLTTLIRAGGAFLPGNLAGDWSFHLLSAGDAPQINGWGHGTLQFDENGAGLVKVQNWSDPASVIDFGTLTVDGAGTILSDTLPDFEGHLSQNKDTITATFTNDSGGASLLVALRRDTPFLGIVPEQYNSVSAVIGSAGGSLQVTADSGTQFDLVIPPWALEDPVTVSMTPLSELNGLPVSGSYLGAVHLAPEGLLLAQSAALIITVPQALQLTDPVLYGFTGAGDTFHHAPLLPSFFSTTASATSMAFPVSHFSGAGAAVGSGTDITGNQPPAPTGKSSADAFYQNLLASVRRDMVDAGVFDWTDDGAGPFMNRTNMIFSDWYDSWIYPQLLFADTIEEFKRVIHSYFMWHSQMQLYGDEGITFPAWYPDVIDQFDTTINTRLEEIYKSYNDSCMAVAYNDNCSPGLPCEATNICEGIQYFIKARPWIQFQAPLAQGGTFPSLTPWSLGDFCLGIGSDVARKVDVAPEFKKLNQIGESYAFSGYWQNFLEDEHQQISHVENQYTNIVTNSGLGVTAVGQGVAMLAGYDENFCVGDTFVVQVANPFEGVWNVNAWKVTNDNCYPPPPMARPETVTITMNGNNLEWADFGGDFNYFYEMTGSVSENNARIGGAYPPELFQQNCDITFGLTSVGMATVKGTCQYTDYNNGLFGDGSSGDICSGTYQLRGFRYDAPL